MPRHPARDPSPSRFGPLDDLASTTQDPLKDGPAPWASTSAVGRDSNGIRSRRDDGQHGKEEFAQVKDLSAVPFEVGCSPLVFGGGVFGEGMYNSDEFIKTDIPLRSECEMKTRKAACLFESLHPATRLTPPSSLLCPHYNHSP